MIPRLRSPGRSATGVFCPTDDTLVKLYYALRQRGIEPGAEYELIGCNNDPVYMNQMHPRSATIDIKLDTVGKRAVEQLLWRMTHPDDTSRVEVFIRPELVLPENEVETTKRAELETSDFVVV